MHLTASPSPLRSSASMWSRRSSDSAALTPLSRQAPSLFASSGSWDAGSAVSVGASP